MTAKVDTLPTTTAVPDAGRHPHPNAASRPEPLFQTTEAAAAKLGIEPDSLRARCRRAAKDAGGASVAQLGGGIVAFKFGRRWRVRFPNV